MATQNLLFLSTFLVVLTFSTGNSLKPENSTVPEGSHYALLQNSSKVLSSYIYCTWDSDCHTSAGYYSECYIGRCICDIGYHSFGGKCVKTSCTFDSDCTVYQSNTRCSFSSGCTCDYNSYINSVSQTCLYYSSGGSGTGQKVGFSLGGFFVLVIIIGLCVLCCRQRRQRLVRVVGPAGGVRGGVNVNVQQQPRQAFAPQPQQPQGGYYQQPQQGYQQQAYQNPNYQQQAQMQQQAPPPPYNPAYAAPAGYPPLAGKI